MTDKSPACLRVSQVRATCPDLGTGGAGLQKSVATNQTRSLCDVHVTRGSQNQDRKCRPKLSCSNRTIPI